MAKRSLDKLKTPSNQEIFHLGPPLDQGPMPTLLWFAVSGDESLTKEPFSKLPTHLLKHKIRIFSLDLPLHSNTLPHKEGMLRWAKAYQSGDTLIPRFIDACKEALNFLIEQEHVDTNHIATAGISRGGYIASHLAAQEEQIGTLLAFSPVTDLSYLRDFTFLKEDPHPLSNYYGSLSKKNVKFYIGNKDVLVNTKRCFETHHGIVEQVSRPPKVELTIYPSIGYGGHGTPDAIFLDGSTWLQEKLLC